jgi:tetratricopeptide (TPR) repeat protein
VQSYLEALELFQRIGGRREESMSAYNLGRAYEEIPGIRDLDQAERWYNRDLTLMADDDIRGHRALQIQLGNLAKQRFEESRKAGEAPEQQARHGNAAIAAYQEALKLTPADQIEALGTTYNNLGNICRAAGQLDASFDYLQKAIQCMVDSSDRYGAGSARCNAGKTLGLAGRYEEALLFYRAGLRDFEIVGAGAGAQAAEKRHLVKTIEEALAQYKGTAR